MSALLALVSGGAGRVWAYGMAVGAALLGLAAMLGGARKAGVQSQQLADIKQRAADRDKADQVQDEVDRMGDDAVVAELRERFTRQ